MLRSLKLPDADQFMWAVFFSAPILTLGPPGLPWFLVSLVFWLTLAWLANIVLSHPKES